MGVEDLWMCGIWTYIGGHQRTKVRKTLSYIRPPLFKFACATHQWTWCPLLGVNLSTNWSPGVRRVLFCYRPVPSKCCAHGTWTLFTFDHYPLNSLLKPFQLPGGSMCRLCCQECCSIRLSQSLAPSDSCVMRDNYYNEVSDCSSSKMLEFTLWRLKHQGPIL